MLINFLTSFFEKQTNMSNPIKCPFCDRLLNEGDFVAKIGGETCDGCQPCSHSSPYCKCCQRDEYREWAEEKLFKPNKPHLGGIKRCEKCIEDYGYDFIIYNPYCECCESQDYDDWVGDHFGRSDFENDKI